MGAPVSAEAPLITGKVVRYDEVRGYGFVAPDDGDEDVFVHANDLSSAPHPIACGMRLEFRVVESARGPKAYDVRVLDGGSPSPAPRHSTAPGHPTDRSADDSGEELCEVLSEREFTLEVTELIVTADDRVTGAQVVAIRDALVKFARSRGWVD
jgi:cold shock protein